MRYTHGYQMPNKAGRLRSSFTILKKILRFRRGTCGGIHTKKTSQEKHGAPATCRISGKLDSCLTRSLWSTPQDTLRASIHTNKQTANKGYQGLSHTTNFSEEVLDCDIFRCPWTLANASDYWNEHYQFSQLNKSILICNTTYPHLSIV